MNIEEDAPSFSLAAPAAAPGHGPGQSPWSPGSLLRASQESFASVLGRAQGAGAAAPLSDAQRAREAAEQLVTQTFVAPMLKQLRESNQAAAPFAPTQAEKQFRALTDADLAQRIVRAARFPLVDRLAQDLLKRAGKDHLGRIAAEELAAGAGAGSSGAVGGVPRTLGVASHGTR